MRITRMPVIVGMLPPLVLFAWLGWRVWSDFGPLLHNMPPPKGPASDQAMDMIPFFVYGGMLFGAVMAIVWSYAGARILRQGTVSGVALYAAGLAFFLASLISGYPHLPTEPVQSPSEVNSCLLLCRIV